MENAPQVTPSNDVPEPIVRRPEQTTGTAKPLTDFMGMTIDPVREKILKFSRVIHPDGTLTNGLGEPRKRFFT